jgi:hypothetical protein
MTCPECHREFKGFVCRVCQQKRQRIGILLHQHRFVQTWQQGMIDLRLKRRAGVLHLELFDDAWHAYCGCELFGVTARDFRRELPPDLCRPCYDAFQEIRAQITAR